MLDAYSNTKWTSTRVAPTRNAPFAGLSEMIATPQEQKGVVLVFLGLGVIALWNGLQEQAAKRRWVSGSR